MMASLLLTEGSAIRFSNVSLPKGTYVKLQPATSDFLDISNPKAVLERGLRIMAVQTQAQDERDMVRAFLGLALSMGRRTAEATATLQLLLREGQLVGDGPAAELLQAEPLSALFATPLRLVELDGWRQLLPG